MLLWLDYDYFINKIYDYDYDYDYSTFDIDYNQILLHDYDYSKSAGNPVGMFQPIFQLPFRFGLVQLSNDESIFWCKILCCGIPD